MQRVLRALENHGLLLLQDKTVMSVAGLITGESLTKSWWSHPRSHEIFRCVQQLSDHPDVLTARLIARKVTFVHRRLWPAFLSVATALDAFPPHTEEVHTESGRHELRTQSWADWAAQHDAHERIAIDEAKAQLEKAAMAIGAKASMLPWKRQAPR